MKKGFLWLGVLLLCGCGYQPLARYGEQYFGDRIFIEIAINYRDPENSVLIKDALLEAIIRRLGASIAPTIEVADSRIHVSIQNIRFASLAENIDGFTSFYRTFVTLHFNYEDKHGKKAEMSTIGRYTFSMQENSILTDARRLDAIEEASMQALDLFITKISTLPTKG